jgi:hypothetical protein
MNSGVETPNALERIREQNRARQAAYYSRNRESRLAYAKHQYQKKKMKKLQDRVDAIAEDIEKDIQAGTWPFEPLFKMTEDNQ